MNDIASEITDSLSRSGKGGMSGALELDDGTESLPGLSFVSDTDSGFYRAGSNDVRGVVAGADRFRIYASVKPLQVKYNGDVFMDIMPPIMEINDLDLGTNTNVSSGIAGDLLVPASTSDDITVTNTAATTIPDGSYWWVRPDAAAQIIQGSGVTLTNLNTAATGTITMAAGEFWMIIKRSATTYDAVKFV
jgi:hypothetical protein